MLFRFNNTSFGFLSSKINMRVSMSEATAFCVLIKLINDLGSQRHPDIRGLEL